MGKIEAQKKVKLIPEYIIDSQSPRNVRTQKSQNTISPLSLKSRNQALELVS